ncbi:hypothetical protein [Hyphobacterium sp.]|uniref:hypothetical protein n=1 Tax=Hyphobacterium sp. TaxID=2004662 RepID=UPI003B521B11
MPDAEFTVWVEAALALPLMLIGLSHVVQHRMWAGFFADLAARGQPGVVWRTVMLEMWPATLIVVFHQDWSWPAIIITLYGHLLMLKVIISLVFPSLGLKSLQQAERFGRLGFMPAGLGLMAIGGLCAYRALPVWLATEQA